MNCFTFLKKRKYKIINHYDDFEMVEAKYVKSSYVENYCFDYQTRILNMMMRWSINEEEAIDLIYHFEINQSIK